MIVVGLMRDNRLPQRFSVTWQNHAVVVTGVRTRNPTLPFACADHHTLMLDAMEHTRRLGYRRPALVLERAIDELVDGRFSAGFWLGQEALPESDRLPAFLDVEAARAEPAIFHQWRERHRPDVLLTLHKIVRAWSEAAGLRVPRDIGLVQLELQRGCEDWAGIDQHNDQTGEAAVDMLISQLHNDDILGLSASPRATLISGSWAEGTTVKHQDSSRIS